jgi:hypothetical protein
MAPNRGAVDHVLPVIGQPQLNKRLKESVPNALFGPAAEAHIDGIPLAVSLMHVAPWAADPQDMHAVKELPIVVGWPRLASRSGGRRPSITYHSSSVKSPRAITAPRKEQL